MASMKQLLTLTFCALRRLAPVNPRSIFQAN